MHLTRIQRLFNISHPERIKFSFYGKIGRLYLTWKNGQWIITNKRLIFFSRDFSFSSNDPFIKHFQKPLALIILLDEIKEVIKKKTKIIIKYLPGDGKLGIGFHEKIYDKSPSIDAIYQHLITPERVERQLFCPNCHYELIGTECYCPNCRVGFNICEICKFQILNNKTQIQCPHCEGYFHKAEFLEWIKVRGRCPSCDLRLNTYYMQQSQFIISEERR